MLTPCFIFPGSHWREKRHARTTVIRAKTYKCYMFETKSPSCQTKIDLESKLIYKCHYECGIEENKEEKSCKTV